MALQLKKASANYVPLKVLIYGVQGIGKDTLLSTFERPCLIPAEEGAGNIDIDTFPLLEDERDAGGNIVESAYAKLVRYITELHGDHNYKTVGVSTLDWLEWVINAEACRLNNWKSIEDPGYGKGYIEADKLWRTIAGGFDSLRRTKGMDVVMLAHGEIKRVDPPDQEPYDRHQMKMQKRALAMWQEWADMVLFANYKVTVAKDGSGFGKGKAKGSGERVLFTTERPTHLAKNRWALPDDIFIGKDATWSKFHEELNKATGGKYGLPKTKNGGKK